MLKRDTTPLNDCFNLVRIVNSLASDLEELRAHKISVDDARARADLAKQIFNGVRLVVSAQKFISEQAKLISNGGGA